jgi:environmental stress-induced protein Ves
LEYNIFRHNSFKTTRWTGGTSIELYIFPTEANYQLRNFSFRLSTAKIEIENSEFTSLPGISRIIMVLDGEINIIHKNHYSKNLKKFDVAAFDGGWKTTSIGKCTDFNLMTQGETKGNLYSMLLDKNQTVGYTLQDNFEWLFIYMHSGKVKLELLSNIEMLNKGDLLAIKNPGGTNLSIKGQKDSELVVSEINLQ